MWQLEFTFPRHIEKSFLDTFGEIFDTISIFESDDRQYWLVKVFFPEEPPKEVNEQVESICEMHNMDIPELMLTKLPETDWLAENRKAFPPIEIACFYVHGSHVSVPQDLHLIPIKVDAALAFGTGEHATTRGCLEVIASFPTPSKELRILDLGCGTAILAIAMAKLWHQPVLAADIDEDSVRLSVENCIDNDVENLVQVRISDGFSDQVLRENAPYELIVANILAGPLCDLAPEMRKYTSPNAQIILSGLLVEQQDQVIEAYSNEGFEVVSTKIIKEWATLHLKVC